MLKMNTRLLIACDTHIFKFQNSYYFKRRDDAEFFDRYLRVFESVRIVARVFTVDSLKGDFYKIEKKNIDIWEIPSFQGPVQFLKKCIKLKKSLKHVEDGCHCAILRLPSITSFQVYKRIKAKKIPYAVEVVYDAYDGYSASSSIFHKLIWKKIDLTMRNICYMADGVSCVTELYLQKRYFSKKHCSFSSFYSSLDLSINDYSSPKKYRKRGEYVISHITNQIEFSGRKGVKELIEAVSLISKYLKVRVKFAGDIKSKEEELLTEYAREKRVEEFVEFVGVIRRSELSNFLSSSDIFVLPTKSEGLPRVLIEAMANGLPCISTNVSGIPELLDSDFLVDYNDVKGLCDRIVKLLTNCELYNNAAENNYNKALQYESTVLQNRRDRFYMQLKNMVD